MFCIFVCRDENEPEDYEEKVVLQLAEQEEDDLEKIKEESRRRSQAILEKYKTQNLQQQPQPEHTGNGCLIPPFFVGWLFHNSYYLFS